MFRGLKNSSARNFTWKWVQLAHIPARDNLFSCHEATCMKGASKLHPELSPHFSLQQTRSPRVSRTQSHIHGAPGLCQELCLVTHTSHFIVPRPCGTGTVAYLHGTDEKAEPVTKSLGSTPEAKVSNSGP